MSTLTAFPYIGERSEATPGLWNQPFSIISANIAAINSDATLTLSSGNTFSLFTSLDASGNLHAKERIGIGQTPSADSTGVMTIGASSATADYIQFHDPSGARSSYLIGSRAGGTADGLNIYDTSGSTMIVSFSKQSIRFFQNVVGPVFDVGGALAGTLNAATFGTGADSKESRIQAAISAATAGYPTITRVYLPANMYPYSAGSISFDSRAQMVREGGDWSTYDVLAYGATGNGIVNDRAAARAAIAGLPSNGGFLVFPGNKTYSLGTTSDDNLLNFTGKNSVSIEATGATITCQSVGAATISNMVYHSNVSGFNWRGGIFVDSGLSLGIETLGARAFFFFNSTTTGGQVTIEQASANSVLAFIFVTLSGKRTRQITLNDCTVTNSYYGINLQENGDSVVAKNFVTRDVRRSVIAYGFHGMDIDVFIESTSTAIAGADRAFEIKRYENDTSDVRAWVIYTGIANHSNAVGIDNQSTVAGGVVQNVDIRLDYVNVTNANTIRPFILASFTSAGIEETSFTTNGWDGIKLAGTFQGYSNPNRRGNGSAPIYQVVSQKTEGRLTLDPSVTPWMTTTDGIHFPAFAVIRGLSGDVLRTHAGAQVANSVFTIPLSGFNGYGGVVLRNKLTVVNDYSAEATQNIAHREDVIMGFNTNGSDISVQQVNNVYNVVQGIAPVVTYAANGENMTVAITGSTYSHVSAWAWCETRHEGVFI